MDNTVCDMTQIKIFTLDSEYESVRSSVELSHDKNQAVPFCKPYINFIIYYSGQEAKLRIFIQNLEQIYHEYTICLNIVTRRSLNYHTNNDSLRINIYKTIEDAVSNIDSDYIFYQNLITLHSEDIYKFILDNTRRTYDYIGINKTIQNTKISNAFKTVIKNSKLPDILYFNKAHFIEKKIKFDIKIFIKDEHDYLILESNHINYMFPPKIPKIIHFYWDFSKFDYLTNLTLKSFVLHNPDWEVNVWSPKLKDINNINWAKTEFVPPHSLPYNDIDYLDNTFLTNELGININYIDYFDLGLKQNVHEVLKSDIFRWKILHKIGGVWSDMDILFVDKIENTDFEKNKCNFNDIEFVVSQYNRPVDWLENGLDFYYIGFLMSSKNCEFYKIMFEESIKNISDESYQGVGGDLMKKHFGLYNNIENIIQNNNYANLQSDSVYHYWWGELKNLFLNNNQQCDFKYIQENNNICGFHWFRGVHLSKIYTHFDNYQHKIQNNDIFQGPLIKWVEHYKSVFNDFKLNKTEKKISIVMGYINRIEQLNVTIQTIIKSNHTNFEIIIVNDGTENLNFLIEKYNKCDIKIIDNSDKDYINPCQSYNLGIEKSTGEIIILQNPECCHIGDVLTATNVLLKYNDYLAFSCYYLDDYTKNDVLKKILFENELDNNDNNFWNSKKIKNLLKFTIDYNTDSVLPLKYNGWASHHYFNPNYLHFCTAIYKKDLLTVGKFSSEYKDGICFDDDDLVRKIITNRLNRYYFYIPRFPDFYPMLGEFSTFVIHQHHDRFQYSDPNIMDKWSINKNLFINNNKEFIKTYLSKNKNIFDRCNLNIENGEIINYNLGIYRIKFNNHKNKIIITPYIEMKKFEYVFNGGSLKLENDILQLYQNCSFSIKISNYNDTNLICNKQSLIKNENNMFVYNGKLINNSIIFENCIEECEIGFSAILENLNFEDNTQFSEL